MIKGQSTEYLIKEISIAYQEPNYSKA